MKGSISKRRNSRVSRAHRLEAVIAAPVDDNEERKRKVDRALKVLEYMVKYPHYVNNDWPLILDDAVADLRSLLRL